MKYQNIWRHKKSIKKKATNECQIIANLGLGSYSNYENSILGKTGTAFTLSGKISVQNMPNELRVFPTNGRKQMHLKFGSKVSNFFCFRSIQRPKILEKEWQETVLRRDCIMEKIRGEKYWCFV